MDAKPMWNFFKKAQTPPDLEKSLAEFGASRADQDAALLRKYDEKSQVLSDGGPEALARHLQDIRNIEDNISIHDTAIEDLKKRIELAAEKENDAKFDARVDEAREINRLLREDYIEIHNLASALADRLRQAKERAIAIQNANTFIIAAKRPELKIVPVLSALARHLGVTTDMIGTSGSNFVHDPVKEFVLPEYYPQEATKFGKRLAALKDIEV